MAREDSRTRDAAVEPTDPIAEVVVSNVSGTNATTQETTPPVANLPDVNRRAITIILGAGASTGGGFRTFLSFPHLFWPTSSEPAKLEATEKERALLRFIMTGLKRKKRPLTTDQFLWVLDEYHRVLKGIFSDEALRIRFSDSLLLWSRIRELNAVVQGVLRRVCTLTVSHYSAPPSKHYVDAAREFYEKLLRENHDGIDVFTTNYDLVPEYLFSRNKWFTNRLNKAWGCKEDTDTTWPALSNSDPGGNEPSDDGQGTGWPTFYNGFADFDSLELAGDDSPDNVLEEGPSVKGSDDNEWSEINYSQTTAPRAIRLYRLHGCVAWYYREQLENAPVYFNSDGITSIGSYYNKLCVMYPGREQNVGCRPHNLAFRQLYHAAFTSNFLIFIGFAFRDADVVAAVFNAVYCRMLLPGSTGKNKMHILIYDPFLDQNIFERRIKQLERSIAVPLAEVCKQMTIHVIRFPFPSPEGCEQLLHVLTKMGKQAH
ncbi:MAG: hypothetical protein HYV27_02985 [Candidatus Hydrogenedentes bacterium]|nr:hypothetical protein [Candidatus Hydrogenedentota bacterium]